MATATKTVQSITAVPRTGTFNKGFARRVRMQGLIPAVVYGAGIDSMAVTVDPKIITKVLYSDSGHNTIFDLAIEGAAAAKGMIVDWQNEPIKGHLLHVDIKRIAMDKMMRVSVPVSLIGTPAGVKTSGGVLSQIMHEVEIECLPGNIPSHIDVDISALEINGAVHISDLPHADNMKFLGDEHALVAHVTLPKEEAATEEVVAAEPEVAKKGKTDAAAAAPAAGAAAAAAPAKKK